MKKVLIAVVISAWCIGTIAFAEKSASTHEGEADFKEHCAMCHPDGGNIMNAKKTLNRKDREANNIKTETDIVKIMRSPGPGMTPFDAKSISDKEAKEIAQYILKTFK